MQSLAVCPLYQFLSMSEDLTPALESPAILAEMQIPRPYPRNTESDYLGMEPN